MKVTNRNVTGKGHIIKEKRTELGFTQSKLAEMTGIAKPTLCYIEKEKIAMTEDEYNKIMAILEPKKKPGRKKKETTSSEDLKQAVEKAVEENKKRRGRRKKIEEAISNPEPIKENKPKRKYTRRKKEDPVIEEKKDEPLKEEKPKRKYTRRKNAEEVTEAETNIEEIKQKVQKENPPKQIIDDSFDDEEELTEEEVFGLDRVLDEDEAAETFDNVNGSNVTLDSLAPSRDEKKQLKQSVLDMAKEPASSIRILVDMYYQMQSLRIVAENRTRSIVQGYDDSLEPKNPPYMLEWMTNQFSKLEYTLKTSLGAYSETTKVGQWLTDIVGIGPCLSAGILAYFSVNENMKSCANFWTYAGLNDNNIPWLGTAKAKKVMTQTRTVVTGRCQARMKNYISLSTNEKRTEVKKILKIENIDQVFVEQTDLNTLSSLLISNGVSKELVKDICTDCTIYENGINMYFNTIKFLYDKTHPTSEFLYILSRSLYRRYKVIAAGAVDKKKGVRTYKRLEKFIAMPPYNLNLKKLCYNIGISFIKQRKRGSMYGELFYQRKEYEEKKNENGDYAEQAAKILRTKNIQSVETRRYLEAGRLTPKHIMMRSLRWTVKLFISHVFDAMYIDAYGRTPELLYPFQKESGHTDWIAPEVPYNKYWNFEDNRIYGSISRTYTPDHTYIFGNAADYENAYIDYEDSAEAQLEDEIKSIMDVIYDNISDDEDK